MADIEPEIALHVRAEHAEGPLWDAATVRLWWVDITLQRVHRFDPASGSDTSWGVPAQPGGVLIGGAGSPIVAMPGGLMSLDVDTGSLRALVPIEADMPENRLNDAKVDGHGRVWAGSMAYDKRAESAALYRIDGRSSSTVVERLTISNGPALDERAGRLYLADTAIGVVDVFDLDSDSGAIGDRRRFLDLSDEGAWPDGMTVDDEGSLWLALGRAGAVRRYGPDGRLDGSVALPVTNPTSVAFGGPDCGDLYITTSWFDLGVDERREQPLAGAIFRCRPGVSGPPSPRCGVA